MKCAAYDQWLIRNELIDMPPYEEWLWTWWLPGFEHRHNRIEADTDEIPF